MPGNIRLWGTSGYVELAAPSTATNQVLTLPTDSIQPGLVLITTQTFSAASIISVNNCFSSLYDNYRINLNINSSSASSSNVFMRMRSSGTDNSTSNYRKAQVYVVYGTTTVSVNESSSADTQFWIDFNVDTATHSRMIDVLVPFLSMRTQISSGIGNSDAWSTSMGTFNGTNSFDGFSIYPASGNLTGTVRIYGYKN